MIRGDFSCITNFLFAENCRRFFFLSLLLVLLTAAGVPSAAYTAEAASADTTMAVHFLDVGQGLSILVQSRGENLLYDGGDRGHSSFVVSYLQKQNISTIDYMISSHYDEDHVAGLVGCLDSFSVKKNVIGADYVQDTKIYQSFENSVASQGLTVQHPEPGTDFAFGSGKFTVLSPQSISSNDNDNSVAIRLETEAIISCLREMRSLPVRKRSVSGTGSFLRCDRSGASWFCHCYYLGSAPGDSSGICSDQLWRR